MICLAKSQEVSRLTIKEMARKEKYPIAYLEKIMRALKRSGLIISWSGKKGGYLLSRKPQEITLKQIIEAIEGDTFEIFCRPELRRGLVCNNICMCPTKPIWKKTKEILDEFYNSITLETLTKPQSDVQQFLAIR